MSTDNIAYRSYYSPNNDGDNGEGCHEGKVKGQEDPLDGLVPVLPVHLAKESGEPKRLEVEELREAVDDARIGQGSHCHKAVHQVAIWAKIFALVNAPEILNAF